MARIPAISLAILNISAIPLANRLTNGGAFERIAEPSLVETEVLYRGPGCGDVLARGQSSGQTDR